MANTKDPSGVLMSMAAPENLDTDIEREIELDNEAEDEFAADDDVDRRKKKAVKAKTAKKSTATKSKKKTATRKTTKKTEEPEMADEPVETAAEKPEEELKAEPQDKPIKKPAAKKPRAKRVSKPKKIEPAEETEAPQPVVIPAMINAKPIIHTQPEFDFEAMKAEWASLKEVSTSLSTNFERVNTLIADLTKEIEAKKATPIPKISIPKIARTDKIAATVSAVAIVISVISILLATNVRQARVANALPVAATQQPVATIAIAPKAVARKHVETHKKRPVHNIKRTKRGRPPTVW